MTLAAATVSAFLIWAPSPDQAIPADATSYRPHVFERHVEAAPCPPGDPGPCYATTAPAVVACPAKAYTDPVMIWQCVAVEPAPDQVIYGCVETVAPNGAVSECWGTFP